MQLFRLTLKLEDEALRVTFHKKSVYPSLIELHVTLLTVLKNVLGSRSYRNLPSYPASITTGRAA